MKRPRIEKGEISKRELEQILNGMLNDALEAEKGIDELDLIDIVDALEARNG